MFCSECHSIMFLKDGAFHCRKCGFVKSTSGKATTTASKRKEKKEIIVIEKEEQSVLPTARVECPSCGYREAYWVLKQTRASDEPETRIYTCKDCDHRWREY